MWTHPPQNHPSLSELCPPHRRAWLSLASGPEGGGDSEPRFDTGDRVGSVWEGRVDTGQTWD